MQNHYLFNKKNEVLLIAISLISCFMSYAFRHYYIIFTGDFSMRFADPDDYMMLVRLRDFFIYGDLSYSLINRVNVPFGTDIYWSRIYDFFLIPVIWFLDLFVNSISKSIEYVAFFTSPVMKSALSIIIFKFLRKLMAESDAFLGALLFAIIPSLGEISEFGRPDHHMFIMILELMYLYSLSNIIKNNFVCNDDYIKSALISALCVWASIETLPLILLAEAAMFLFFCKNIKILETLYKKTIITALIIGTIVFFLFPLTLNNIVEFASISLMAVVAFFCKSKKLHLIVLVTLVLFFIKNDSFAYDKISIMHFILYLCASLFLLINIMSFKYVSKHIIKFSLTIGLIFIAVLLYRYPKFLLGIEGEASDFLRIAWFPKIDDLLSPLSSKFTAGCFCLSSIILFVAVYNKICVLINKKYENIDVFWWILILLNIAYFFFSCMVCRSITTLVAISLPLILNLGLSGIAVKCFSRKINICITCLLILIPSTIQKYGAMTIDLMFQYDEFMKMAKNAQNSLRQKDVIYKFLDNISETPLVIMSDPYLGPKILYKTKHNVVSVPFHSHEKGIISSMIITMEHSIDEKTTKEVLKTTNTSYVFVEKPICNCFSPHSNLVKMIEYGHIPPWVELVDLPIEKSRCILAKIDKNEL